MTSINPYLIFGGNCAEAFDFYKSVLGGEFLMRSTFKDMECEEPVPESEFNKIMHVALPIGQSNILMGSDSPESMPVTIGNNFSVSISTDSEKEADRLFNGLSAGGRANMPMGKAFWGSYFGMLTDKFGINWMISYDYHQSE